MWSLLCVKTIVVEVKKSLLISSVGEKKRRKKYLKKYAHLFLNWEGLDDDSAFFYSLQDHLEWRQFTRR